MQKGGDETAMRIRDAVVGDIWFSELEEHIIKTPTFQRLHRIKQLGNTFHVYPGAMHTRFEHSLGVYYQVERILKKRDLYYGEIAKDSADDIQIIKLAALLHDIVHTPFRHTLDRDTQVIKEPKRKMEYTYRIEQISSEIKSLFSEDFPQEQKTRVLKILNSAKAANLAKPYHKQIIEDTLSGDLLDYTVRDCYYTGLHREWDPRIYDHIIIANYNKKPHIVASIIDEDGKIAQSAITEIRNLIDIRYTLNERVYFYAAKIAADSLLIKAVRNLFTTRNVSQDQFMERTRDMSDEEFINYLVENLRNDQLNYAQLLKDRRLPALAVELKPGDIDDDEKENIAKNCSGYHCYNKWLNAETKIAKEAHIAPENVIIYCHHLEMQAKKKPGFLILYDKNKEPCPIGGYPEVKTEIEQIAEKQEKLWRCYVFSIDRSKSTCDRIKEVAKDVLISLT